jgi:hypothetical protein
MKALDFRVRVEVDHESGKTLAVYLQIRQGKAHRVKELAEGNAFANFDREGRLLGVELLAPCNLAVFDSATVKESVEVKQFISGKIPREMALGA